MKTKDSKETTMSGMGRRGFLVTAGMGLGGLLVLDTLTACRPTEPGDPGFVPPFSEEDDIHFGLPLQFTEKTVQTTCWIGKQDCGVLARVLTQTVNGQSVERIVKLEGNPRHPRNLGKLCPKGMAQLQAVYDYNRVKWPLRRINAKGQPGRFLRITWDEAYDEINAQLADAKANAKPILWQKGRSKSEKLYDNGFQKALASWGGTAVKVYKQGHGAYCSDGGYKASEYTLGAHGVISPDIAHTEYLISWGWGLTTTGGNKLCWITWPRKFIEARGRTNNPLRKVVVLDPNRRQTGPHSEEWLPNRPGSDLAFFLGLAHYLVHNTASGFANGLIDEEYLTSHTNAVSLVFSGPGDPQYGQTLRRNASGVVYDPSNPAHDIANFTEQAWAGGSVSDIGTASPELLVDGQIWNDGTSDRTLSTTFQLYKDHLAPYTPTWAAETCGLPPLTVARIARELFEHARVGATITIDGVTMPHRPVGLMAYHVAQQELGFVATRAAINVFQLLGAIDVPGGIQADFGQPALNKNWDGLNEISIETSNLSYDLGKSKFFPISSGCPSFIHRAQFSPERYDMDQSTIPKKVIVHMSDPARAYTDSPVIRQAYSQFEHVTVLTPWMSETAHLFADLILPAATIEKYEGPMSGATPDETADALRLPPITPLWESKGELDIYLDIAERVGFLDTYTEIINEELGLQAPNVIDAAAGKPTARAIFDNWAKSKGISNGIEYFEENGVTDTTVRAPDQKYTYAMSTPYHGARHRLYGEKLREYGIQMRSGLGYAEDGSQDDVIAVELPHVLDYTPFPTWRPPTMWRSEVSHPLHLLTYKKVEFKQSRASFVPYLGEISPRQGLLINPQTARALGVGDGDEVYVESHNALTGETRQVKTRAVLHSTIRPDTVAMSHHYGLNVTPTNEGQGPSPNELFFAGEGYVQCTQDASFHVMVRVTKA